MSADTLEHTHSEPGPLPDEVTDRPTTAGSSRPSIGRTQLVLAAVPVLAAAAWWSSLLHADPLDMGELGLISLLGVGSMVALVLLTASFLTGVRLRAPDWVLGIHLVTFIALIHATPAVLYGTLRYSWAYKHVGIIDYILRHGSVDRTLPVGDIYHNWPGFFAGGALLTSLAGESDALRIASWAPLAFNLLNLVLLRYVFRGLTRNRRLIWLGLWFFFVINWVGQDYFSPQAMVYVLYLAVLGLLVRRSVRAPMLVTFTILVGVVAASHQITPMMLLLAVTALVALRRTPGWYLPVITAGLTAGWAFSWAAGYTLPNIAEFVEGFGRPVANASETLAKTGDVVTGSEALVVWAGRSVVIISTIMALIGVWRSWRVRGLRVTALLLMLLPATLVLVTGFGGEVLFRSFLFAAPFIAFLCAAACLPPDGRGFPMRSRIITATLSALLLPGFLLSYYGKEASNYFTPDEVAAASWIERHAPADSLLIAGNSNYPHQNENYERFTYVSIDIEPDKSRAAVLADPVRVLGTWMSNPRYRQAYLILTRSQNEVTGRYDDMPANSLSSIEGALRRSPDFTIAYENAYATVFTRSERTQR